MFIQTEAVIDYPDGMKFFPGEPVLSTGTAEFPDEESAERSPLAQRLFAVDGVAAVILDPEAVMVAKETEFDWQVLKPLILGAIMEHYTSGQPIIANDPTSLVATESEEIVYDEVDAETQEKVEELLATRIKPVAEQTGGDVHFIGMKDGFALMEFEGGTLSLLAGINNVVRHYLPEIKGVKDVRDATPKPGLGTPEATTIQQVLDERINPAVAGHGGYISLIDVQEDRAYIRLEGGCQGCGMADVTLKQGIEVEIKDAVPTITQVLDVTDHAGGSNPYYTPGKSGAAP